MNRQKKEAIILFTRVPYPGKTKTRLMPIYSPRECAEIHTCFLRDIYQQCVETGRQVFVCYTDLGQEKLLHKILPEITKDQMMLQCGVDLGARMGYVMQRVLDFEYDSVVLLGSDVPEIKAEQIGRAFHALDMSDVVFIPTMDKGYCLVGMKKYIPETFQDQTYGSGAVLENAVDAINKAGYSVTVQKPVYDIDTPVDVLELRGRLRYLHKNRTRRYLAANPKISVIIPVYNESSTIETLQRELKKLPNCEIIFVDGGSKDDTVAKINHKYHVLTCEKGRAAQMNLGAMKSHGDILFFLHADSELPKNAVKEIREVMKNCRWGCFGIAYHERNFFLWTCQVISNHRIKDRKIVFGDQGIFIDRQLFFEAGMYPELPIMEDYQFSLTMKEMNERIGKTKHHIYTSSRRFKGNTFDKLRVMWKMNRLRKMYRDGVDIQDISNRYKDIR